jgi:hypothetical protein
VNATEVRRQCRRLTVHLLNFPGNRGELHQTRPSLRNHPISDAREGRKGRLGLITIALWHITVQPFDLHQTKLLDVSHGMASWGTGLIGLLR